MSHLLITFFVDFPMKNTGVNGDIQKWLVGNCNTTLPSMASLVPIITQATNFDIRGVIDDGIVILCNKTGFQYSKLSTNTSNIFTSSSTSETPHDLAEDDYHEVGWDYDDEEEEGEGESDEEEGEGEMVLSDV